MAEPIDNLATKAQIEELQVVRPVWELAGHEVCADVHLALAIAKAILTSRQKRVAEPFASPSTEELVREPLSVHPLHRAAHLCQRQSRSVTTCPGSVSGSAIDVYREPTVRRRAGPRPPWPL